MSSISQARKDCAEVVCSKAVSYILGVLGVLSRHRSDAAGCATPFHRFPKASHCDKAEGRQVEPHLASPSKSPSTTIHILFGSRGSKRLSSVDIR
jgi:hypothetical protein